MTHEARRNLAPRGMLKFCGQVKGAHIWSDVLFFVHVRVSMRPRHFRDFCDYVWASWQLDGGELCELRSS